MQNYAWGRPGAKSVVAQLAEAADPIGGKIDDTKTYAELWYGTHPSGPSRVISSHTTSSGEQKQFATLESTVGASLPFIFKILSINGALSLQAHPDKTLAAKLHKEFPQHYKDPNHKPELVLAVSDMEVLCGFRPLAQIALFVRSIPEFARLVPSSAPRLLAYTPISGVDNSPEAKQILRAVFAEAMRADAKLVGSLIDELMGRIASTPGKVIPQFTVEASPASSSDPSPPAPSSIEEYIKPKPSALSVCPAAKLESLLQTLSQQYPGDVGVFGPLFLNYFELRPGQSVFLEPNVPHAYLQGECVEVMACSDNVVRAGLTPKFRDVDTLVSMLTYDMTPPAVNTGAPVPLFAVNASSSAAAEKQGGEAKQEGKRDVAHAMATTDTSTVLYAPPAEFPEFMLTRTVLSPATASQHTLPPVRGASVLLCLGGKATASSGEGASSTSSLGFGKALYIPGGQTVVVTAEGDGVRCRSNCH